jgi:hypothetical protein
MYHLDSMSSPDEIRVVNGPDAGNNVLPSRESLTTMTREAESRGLEYNPAERVADVRATLDHVMRWKAEGKTRQEIEETLGSFVNTYPTLFNKMMEPNPDMNMLKSMLSLMDRMGSGSVTQHQASVIVGQRLAEKFIRPIVGSDMGTPEPERRR